jgi:hypothetical protein
MSLQTSRARVKLPHVLPTNRFSYFGGEAAAPGEAVSRSDFT